MRAALAGMAGWEPEAPALPEGATVLYDGMWHNPNLWYRLSLVRAALGFRNAKEIGLTGRYNRHPAEHCFREIGISDIRQFKPAKKELAAARQRAKTLVNSTASADDILQWELEYEQLPALIYDGILKRQRGAVVNVSDPNFTTQVAEALVSVSVANRILDETRPAIVLVSHLLEFSYGVLSLAALHRGIPVILLFGLYGAPKLKKLEHPRDIQNFYTSIRFDQLTALPEERRRDLESMGQRMIEARVGGEHSDIGSTFAFKRANWAVDRDSITKAFKWDSSKPIIAVFTSNWFDYPHSMGLNQFRDFLDWLEVTLNEAREIDCVNWLFKPHPCDQLYGGITINDLISVEGYPHVAIAENGWRGADLIDACDGLITVYSTAAIEFAALGKPVLSADTSWYHDAGFVRCAQSRAEYQRILHTTWWADTDIAQSTWAARVFAGIHFGRPDWQDDCLLPDDFLQDDLFEAQCEIMSKAPEAIEREIRLIREWFGSDYSTYHTFKMLTANAYTASRTI